MKRILQVLSLTAIGCVGLFLTGCAGLEVGGRAGIYRVDERSETQKTYHVERARPLKCWFTDCGITTGGSTK